MTPQEKLHAVETAIRTALPRLKEVKEGCWFHNEITLKKEKLILIDVNKNYVLLKEGGKNFSVFSKEKIKKFLQIIGHEILLSDVLEWVKTLKYDFKNTIINDWDLSKPHLKDQFEELWDFLYNLIKKD